MSLDKTAVLHCCRLLTPLLPLVFSPLTIIRRAMANLLTQLMFVTASSAQQGLPQLQHSEHEGPQPSVQLAECFTLSFSFPCAVQAFAAAEGKAVHRPIYEAQVTHCIIHLHLLTMQQMLWHAAFACYAPVSCRHHGTLTCA